MSEWAFLNLWLNFADTLRLAEEAEKKRLEEEERQRQLEEAERQRKQQEAEKQRQAMIEQKRAEMTAEKARLQEQLDQGRHRRDQLQQETDFYYIFSFCFLCIYSLLFQKKKVKLLILGSLNFRL